MKFVQPLSPADFEKYYLLRWEILRKPWKQERGSEQDHEEADSIHGMVLDEAGEVIAVCRLQHLSVDTGRLRYMAVKESVQGKGAGSFILQQMELIAKAHGIKELQLQAREGAVRFYEKNDYRVIEKSFLLYDEIQHYFMKKDLLF